MEDHLIGTKPQAAIRTVIVTHNALAIIEHHGILSQKCLKLCSFGTVFTKLIWKIYMQLLNVFFWFAKGYHNITFLLYIWIFLPFWFPEAWLQKHCVRIVITSPWTKQLQKRKIKYTIQKADISLYPVRLAQSIGFSPMVQEIISSLSPTSTNALVKIECAWNSLEQGNHC